MANGVDNISVYVPLFSSITSEQHAVSPQHEHSRSFTVFVSRGVPCHRLRMLILLVGGCVLRFCSDLDIVFVIVIFYIMLLVSTFKPCPAPLSETSLLLPSEKTR